jgi:hypothetical protein
MKTIEKTLIMKKPFNIKSLIMIGMIGVSAILSSCVKQDFAEPEATIPSFSVPAGDTLISIQELKAMHTIAGHLDSIKNNYYIKGVVTGNDQYGNIYKTLYIQDSTGGIVISLNKTSLYNEYKQGQVLYVKCKNLVLGDYGGTPQIGAVYNGGTGQLPEIAVPNHLFKDGMPGAVPSPVHIRTSTELADGSNISKLVILDSCSFTEVGKTFVADDITTDRALKLKDGTPVTVRTSNYAAFKNSIIPDGYGTVIGLLGTYNGSPQLVIRNINDVYGFYVDPRIILKESFAISGSLGQFSQVSVTGAQTWGQSVYSGVTMAKMTGYVGGSSYANEDWMISKSLDLSHRTNVTMSFNSAMSYGVVGDGSLQMFYSTDYTDNGNPSSATWNIIPGFTLSSGSFAWTPSGSVSIPSSALGTNVHFAFKYTCGTSSVPTWEITNVMILGDPTNK